MLNTANQVVPFYYKGSMVRTVTINGEPCFSAKDICDVLDIKNSRDAIKRLDADEVSMSVLPTPSGAQEAQVVTESGMYHLAFTSIRPEAKAFRKWVTAEVLPALRQRGAYEVGEERHLPKAPKHGHGVQGTLWPMPEGAGSNELARARSLMLDVALQAKPGSKVAQLVRLIKPMVMEGHSL
jgi:prophage antirepressor-like protein